MRISSLTWAALVGLIASVDCSTSSTAAPPRHRPAAVVCSSTAGSRDGATGNTGDCDAGGVTKSPCIVDQCTTDAECHGGVCSCAGNTRGYGGASPANVCIPANCHTDADCASGYCSPSVGLSGPFYGIQGYYCHTSKDECTNDGDCGSAGATCAYCAYNSSLGHWACATTCAAG